MGPGVTAENEGGLGVGKSHLKGKMIKHGRKGGEGGSGVEKPDSITARHAVLELFPESLLHAR